MATKLILYRTKSQILSTALLSSNKSLTYKQDYLQYTDDANVFWSLNFTSSDEAEVFLQELEKKCAVSRASANEIAAAAIKVEAELSEAAIETDTNAEKLETTTDASKKSSVVQRMAKVGQALHMLSATNQSNANDTDSSISSNGGGGDNGHSSLILSSVPSHSQSKPTNISVAVQPVPNYWQSSSVTANYTTTNLNSFITENRVQNAEVRMNLGKLETKLERVLDNIEMLKLSSGRSSGRNSTIDSEEEIIKLEEKIVELKKENRLLKLKAVEAASNEQFVMAPTNEELAPVKEELKTVKRDLEKLRQQNVDKETKIHELEGKLQMENEKANVLTSAKAELERKLQESERKLKAEMELKKSVALDTDKRDAKILELGEKVKSLTAKIVEHEKSGEAAQTKGHETIRSIMNKLYVELFQSVNGRDTMTSAEVLKLTAELIRRETKAALNQST